MHYLEDCVNILKKHFFFLKKFLVFNYNIIIFGFSYIIKIIHNSSIENK